jgi:CheY-like chemotaxis protein
MNYMPRSFGEQVNGRPDGTSAMHLPREPLILIIEDEARLTEAFRSVCECLDVAVMRITSRDDLGAVLRKHQPMAVVAELDSADQDGCYVLMTVAKHDHDLPVLLMTGDASALLGAVDAVEEIWELSSVDKWPEILGVGAVVDFLFRAGRKGNCMRLMSI